jgi:hypothetical protein
MVQLTEGKLFEKLKKQYTDLIETDASVEVRVMLLSSLHTVAELLGPEEAYKHLSEVFARILREKDTRIITTIAERIDLIYKALRPLKNARAEL